jgi:hypothetical protein
LKRKEKLKPIIEKPKPFESKVIESEYDGRAVGTIDIIKKATVNWSIYFKSKFEALNLLKHKKYSHDA